MHAVASARFGCRRDRPPSARCPCGAAGAARTLTGRRGLKRRAISDRLPAHPGRGRRPCLQLRRAAASLLLAAAAGRAAGPLNMRCSGTFRLRAQAGARTGRSSGVDVRVCAGDTLVGAGRGMGMCAGDKGARTKVERAGSRWMMVDSSEAMRMEVSDSMIIEAPPVLRL